MNAILVLVVLTSLGGPLLTQWFARRLAPETAPVVAAGTGALAAPALESANTDACSDDRA